MRADDPESLPRMRRYAVKRAGARLLANGGLFVSAVELDARSPHEGVFVALLSLSNSKVA